MARRLVGGLEVGGGEEPALPDHRELHAGIGGGRAGFVPDDMRLVADHDLVARTRQQLEGDLVRHRAAGYEERRLLSQLRSDALLQAIDRGILAVLVVADRRLRHGLAHGRRRQGHGIGAKVDGIHGRLRKCESERLT